MAASFLSDESSSWQPAFRLFVTVRIPFLPEFIDSDTATGQFAVERDRYIDG